jgi:ABC-type Fe3+/spermidine/putrescine transport system ATPase subunit
VLNVSQLEKRLGRQDVLKGVDLNLEQGECIALFGPSGCGKTTLLRLIAGLDEPDAGTIAVNETVASDPRIRIVARERRIAMVFQDLALWPHMTALGNVEFAIPRTLRGRNERRSRAREVLASVHLHDHQDKRPHQLSGGEQQRVAIARAVAQEPRVLLLDEPFSSLDADLKQAMLALVREIHLSRGLTIIYVTHVAEDILGLAGRVAAMQDGRITETLSAEAFMQRQGIPA